MEKFATSKGIEKHIKRIKGLEGRVSEVQEGMGDATTQSNETWHDNAPYEVLCLELRIADKRLNDAYKEIQGCKIAEYPTNLKEEKVCYGTKVKFKRDGREDEVCIVGYGDSDTDKGRILYQCPLALALMDRSRGESFEAQINGKPSKFVIKSVSALGELD